jgi:polygalacturonase
MFMRARFFSALSLAVCAAATAGTVSAQSTAPAPPPPPARTINIQDAGAVPDGKTMNTAAIQKAIDSLAQQGGGTLVIPAAPPAPDAAPTTSPATGPAPAAPAAGAFLSGALFLKPGVNLHLDKGAILKGSTDARDYPTTRTRIEGHFQDWLPALVNAIETDNLRIDGEGTLDGSGAPFYAAFRNAGREGRPTTNVGTPRPRLFFLSSSNNITVSGVHLLNSGFWNLHVYKCRNVTIDGIDISAPSGSPSTDGIDIDSCQWVTIKNTSISNNDDCIAIKGSKGIDADQDKDSPPDEHIRVSNCRFTMGGSVVTCGSEATFVRDVVVEDCVVAGPNTRGINVLRLKLRTDTPQVYENIHYNNITLDGVGTLIKVDPWTQYETIPAGRQRPSHTVRNISLTNIKGTFGTFGNITPVVFQGAQLDTIEKITLENIDLKLTNAVPNFRGVKELVVKNVKINGADYVPPPALTQPASQPAMPPASAPQTRP